MGFQGAFRDPKSQFPAKYHIFKHYTTKYRFSKNVIFCGFSWFFGFLLIQYVAGIGRKWPDTRNFVGNVFLRLFRSVFMPIACISRRKVSRGGGLLVVQGFWTIFFKKSRFWGTMRSYDAVKLSADSLEDSLQDSNIILNFRDDFRFLWAPASTLLLQLRLGFALGNSLRKAKNCLMVKKSRFFKVSDTFTII